MTRDEYLKNHDAHEGAEEESTDHRCPICGSDECEKIYRWKDTKEIVGCDNCVEKIRSELLDVTFYVMKENIEGDDGGIEEVDWEAR